MTEPVAHRRAVLLTACLTAGAAACALPPVIEQTQQNIGQPSGDFPSYDERVTLYATNRARVDPAAEGWPAFPPQPPLLWHLDLNRSARAHSIDMRDTPCFQHNSCNGTDLFVRIRSFYTAAATTMGENISAGRMISDGFIAVHNWIYEIGAAPGETGHRENIFSSRFTLLGAGFAPGGTQSQNYWTQDFVGTPVTRPRLPDGIHFPRTVAAGGTVTFGTSYFDAAGMAPAAIAVVVDGGCIPLALARGAAGRGAYEGEATLTDGCHPYYFVSATAGGAAASYPDTGALQVGAGAGGGSCPLYVADRVEVRCGAGDDAAAPEGDGAAPNPTGTGGTAGGPGAGPGDAGSAGPAVGGCVASESGGEGSSGCTLGQRAPGAGGLAVMFLSIFSLLRRRR